MAEQHPLCPGCGKEPFVSQWEDQPQPTLECNECSFRADAEDWQRRTPGPATRAMLEWLRGNKRPVFHPQEIELIERFLVEWPEPERKGGA
jgi:Zn ribbon nucleic-acid-binding protein